MSYQQCTRFRTTLDSNHKYLWNASRNRQVENGVINNCFSHVRWKQFGELGPLTKKLTLTFDLEIQQGSRSCWVICLCKISSIWMQRFMIFYVHTVFLPYLAMVKNPEMRSCDLEILWVSSSCQGGTCSCKIYSSSWVVVVTEKKLWRKQYGR